MVVLVDLRTMVIAGFNVSESAGVSKSRFGRWCK